MTEYAVVGAQWHTFYVGGASLTGDLPPTLTLFSEGPEDDDVVVGIRSGVALGPVLVAVEPMDSEPPLLSDDWTDIAETSITISEVLTVYGIWDDAPAYSLDASPGHYRLRVSAQGREIDYDAAATEPLERYLLQFWPAPTGPTSTLRATTPDLLQ